MKDFTIEDAIVQVLRRNPNGLTPSEITQKIEEQKLYNFNTNEPISVVDHTIRKACVGVDIEISKEEKVFEQAPILCLKKKQPRELVVIIQASYYYGYPRQTVSLNKWLIG